MLGTEGFVDIQVLHRQGMSIRGIAKELGIVRRQSIWHRLSYFLRDTFLPVLSPV